MQVRTRHYFVSSFIVNFGVPEFGSFSGKSNFIIIGMGKSTPVSTASPSPSTGRKSNVFLLAVLQALLIAYLSL